MGDLVLRDVLTRGRVQVRHYPNPGEGAVPSLALDRDLVKASVPHFFDTLGARNWATFAERTLGRDPLELPPADKVVLVDLRNLIADLGRPSLPRPRLRLLLSLSRAERRLPHAGQDHDADHQTLRRLHLQLRYIAKTSSAGGPARNRAPPGLPAGGGRGRFHPPIPLVNRIVVIAREHLVPALL